jgi:hypothetical protein
MSWKLGRYSPEEIDNAGKCLAASEQRERDELNRALGVISYFRAIHAFPLNTFQKTLRRKSPEGSIVAQRMKRMPSIQHKLERFDWLKLSEMQDIAGCRCVLPSAAAVQRLVRKYKASDLRHPLIDEDDYVEKPKLSGYRSYHLIYSYRSDRTDEFNDLKIEMQFRSSLQHAWATAVETVGMFRRQSLKSSQGDRDWLRFFALMASELAYREKSNLVPRTPENPLERLDEIRELADRLDVMNRLSAYSRTLRFTESFMPSRVGYYLIDLNVTTGNMKVSGYRARDREHATQDYLSLEKEILDVPGRDAVLVAVESITSLKRAYPNYYFDTELFMRALRHALRPRPPYQHRITF